MRRLRVWAYRALRWSERYTKTDMVYAAKGGFWLLLAKGLTVLAGLGMSVAFANLMEPEKYGVYKYALALVSIAGTFSLVGMGTAVNQATARGFEGALRKGHVASLRWSIGVIIVAGAMALYYFMHGNAVIGCAILVGGALTPFIGAASLYDNFLGGKQLFAQKTWYNLVRASIPAIILILALFITNDPIILSALYFASTCLVTYWCYGDVLKRYRPHQNVDETTLAFSKHLSVMSIMTTIVSQLDRVLVFSQIGGSALAVYSFAEAGPDQVRSLGGIINSLAFPKMSQRPFRDIRKTIVRKTLIVFCIATMMTLLYILLAPFLFTTFFPRYIESVAYSQVYALAMPIALPSILFSQALVSHMKKRELYINNIASSIFRVILLVVLVHFYGIWGIIIGTIASYLFNILLLIWTFSTAQDAEDHLPGESTETKIPPANMPGQR